MDIFKFLLLDSWFEINTPMNWTLSGTEPVSYVEAVLLVVIQLSGLIAAAFIVFGAYTLITASGEPENIAKGQKMITNAVIGLILVAIAFLIVNFVIDFVPDTP